MPMEDNSNFFKLLLIDESLTGELSVMTSQEKELVMELEYSDILKKLKKEREALLRKKVNQHSIEKILLHLAH